MTKPKNSNAISVGNFDGVHLGHQAILRILTAEAKKRDLTSVAIFFDPHPAAVLGYAVPPTLTTQEHRTELLIKCGVDRVIVAPFTKSLSHQTAQYFLEEFLVRNNAAKFIALGPTTHFGKNREGTPEKISEIAHQIGLDVVVASSVSVGGKEVSSSRVRNIIAEGNMSEAKDCLGRYHSISGVVVKGVGRGRKIGIPTANLSHIQTMLPGSGVYMTNILYEGKSYKAATNIGVRPTFGANSGPMVESHLVDFTGDLYGKTLTVEWIARIRKEEKFPSSAHLVDQIHKDLTVVRNFVL